MDDDQSSPLAKVPGVTLSSAVQGSSEAGNDHCIMANEGFRRRMANAVVLLPNKGARDVLVS